MKRLVIGVLILVGWLQAQTTIPQVLQLQEPALPAVTNITANYVGGTPGVTTFYYWFVARYVVGNSTFSAPVAVNSITNGVGSVVLSWVAPNVQTNKAASTNPSVPIRFDVLRTTSATFPSNGNCVVCLVASNTLALTVTDTFSVLSDYTSATYTPSVYSLSIDNTSSLLVGNSPILNLSMNGIGSNLLQWVNTSVNKNIPINAISSSALNSLTFMEFGVQKALLRYRGTTNATPNALDVGTSNAGGVLRLLSGNGILAESCDANQICTFTNPISGGGSIPRVVTAPDASSITPNTATSDVTYQSNSQAAGTLTINATTGTSVDGQHWILKINACVGSGGTQTYSWNSVYESGSDVTLPTTTSCVTPGTNLIDQLGFIFDVVKSKWEIVAIARGY